jgi:hypothetical protein
MQCESLENSFIDHPEGPAPRLEPDARQDEGEQACEAWILCVSRKFLCSSL